MGRMEENSGLEVLSGKREENEEDGEAVGRMKKRCFVRSSEARKTGK